MMGDIVAELCSDFCCDGDVCVGIVAELCSEFCGRLDAGVSMSSFKST
jgi:hypothetical protein